MVDVHSSIQNAPGAIWGFLEQYGYYLLALVVLVWMIKPHIQSKVQEHRHKKALEEATDPSRVQELEEERRKVRERQQEELARRSQERAKKEKEKKSEEKKSGVNHLKPSPRPGGNSPLNPQTRQPHRFGRMRNRPSRG
eukprot:gb/GECG01015867.1/.p1 GENE.gb/GECG01015867.1/~~gb/GECG01015867.1/.p1  ORF type:complete len:139 (+),score=25.31 gb/GECG01015867.1/:1-417(+)